jgi:hypothetical protein
MRSTPFLFILFLLAAGSCQAIGTAINFQGTLEDNGLPANGSYDLQFQVKSAGGSPIGPLLTIDNQSVVNGVFTVQLDFGAGVFSGADRKIAMFVRAGDSVGGYTSLLPELPVSVAPHALVSANSELADLASDVTDYAIDNIDIGTGAVDARTIQPNSVGASEIAADAVGASEIAADAVGASELANNSVGIANLIGANYTSPANLNATIAANDCSDYDIPVGGGFEPGDAVVLNTLTAVPSNVLIQPLQVTATNTVKIRFCNVGSVSQSLVNLQIRMISLR